MKTRSVFRLRTLATAGLALAFFVSGHVTPVELPKIQGVTEGSGKPQEKKPAAEPDLGKIREGIEKELKAVQERIARAEAGKEPAPPGVSPRDIEDANRVRSTLVYAYQSQLDALSKMADLKKAREAAELAEKNWSGFEEAPPYSILLADDIQDQLEKHREALALLESSRRMIKVETERFRDRSAQAQESVRRATDTFQRAAAGTDAHAKAAWYLEKARDEAKLAEVPLATSTLLSAELDEKLASAQASLRLAERKRALLEGKVRITDADVATMRARLEELRQSRQKQLDSLVAARAREARVRDQAQRAVDKLRGAQASAPAEKRNRLLQIAEARLRASQVRMESLQQQAHLMSVLVTVYYQMLLDAWKQRYVALVGDDADARQAAKTRLVESADDLKAWLKGIEFRRSEVQALIREQEARVRSASDPEPEKYERQALDTARELDLTLRGYQATVSRHLSRLVHWQQEFGEAVRARSVSEIAGEAFVGIKAAAEKIWNFELLTIEDTAEIGGQKVTTTRGITVGKSLGAILLFLIGYQLMRFLSANMERVFVRRFHVGLEQGRTLRRWADTLGVFLLLMITLNVARIPLTVFAFAGGALAIGIGFGTQTLIKNLISGIILLVERQVKVGDIVEVEGVVGTVIEVNIRSSTVRGFDGVETIVPNSQLLEQKVTNWTLSNKQVRRIIRVGVAYGSPVRQVAEILADCAGRHGLVMKNPAPFVIFEDFGDNALVFAVYLWVDLAPDTNALQVMSDIRFMIEKQLGEAGIVVAFPQRDVHLDASRPLKVEVVPPGTPVGSGGEQANRG